MTQPLKVLLVEDNEADAELIRRELAKSGYEVEAKRVEDPKAFIEAVRGEPYDLILSDYTLNSFNGLAALDEARRLRPETPFIFVSGTIGEERAIEALKRGATDYVLKDRLSRLVPVARRALREAQASRDLERSYRDLKEANERLEELSLVDPLTGLRNRRGLQRALTRLLGLAERQGSTLLAVLLDLDDFKRINDSLGYVVGDVVLKEISARLTSCLRETDFAARIGGDEFLLLLPNTKVGEGMQLAERIRLAIGAEPIVYAAGSARATVSIGIVDVTPQVSSVDEILSMAHLILRHSKGNGKNRVSWTGDDAGTPHSLAHIVQRLRDGEAFYALRQPIVRIADGSTAGHEMLSRSRIGMLEGPSDFFRVGYEANILTLIDHQCFRVCARTAGELALEGRIHLNVFPSTLINVPVADLLEALPAGVPPGRFCLEISEQQIIGDPSYLKEPLEKVKQAGLAIAIDDVGFGKSCLESLVILEPDFVKIDKRCVSGVAKDMRFGLQTLRRLLSVADALGCRAIAEGIETREDLEAVTSVGVKYGQGYLWGRPA